MSQIAGSAAWMPYRLELSSQFTSDSELEAQVDREPEPCPKSINPNPDKIP